MVKHNTNQSKIVLGIFLIIFIFDNVDAKNCYRCSGIECFRTTKQDKQATCATATDQCYTVFEKFAVLAKGCSAEIPITYKSRCGLGNVICEACDGDLCNKVGRRNSVCYQCEGKNCEQPTNTSRVQCESPTAMNSYCYTRHNDTILRRGCAITTSEQKRCSSDGICDLCLPNLDGTPSPCNGNPYEYNGVARNIISNPIIIIIISVFAILIRK